MDSTMILRAESGVIAGIVRFKDGLTKKEYARIVVRRPKKRGEMFF